MKYQIELKLNNGKSLLVGIDKPELIYGAVAIVTSEKIEGTGINPVNGKSLDIITIPNEETRFFIPGHIQKDYEYAKENGIDIVQVVAPYFIGKDEETPREDVKTQIRYSVVAIIKNAENDTYLCEDARNRNCKSFVMGGIEENESPEDAAIRETNEETGYRDLMIDYVSNFSVINHFYAGYKGVNRYAYLNFVFGHLKTNAHIEITDEENNKHVVKWVEKKDLRDFININLNKLALEYLLNGEKAFEDDGVMMTLDSNNGKNSKEVRKEIIKKYC